MSANIQIKRFELGEREELLSFLRSAYPGEPRKSDPVCWNWHFVENPYATSDSLPLWILKSGQRIVGQMASLPVRLKVGDDQRPAIWVLDFVIHPDYRGKGLGKRLVRAAGESNATMLTLGVNEQSTPVFRSLQWASLGGIHRYHKILFPGDAFGEVSRFGLVRRVLNFGYAPFRRTTDVSPPAENKVFRSIDEFDSSFADLWQRASRQWSCAVAREPDYLRWQFRQQPEKKFEVLGLHDQSRLLGYVVLFFRKPEHGPSPPKVAITDLCYDASRPVELIDDLLKGALRLALERRAGSLVIDVLDARVEESLRRFGFWRIKNSPRFMAYTTENQDLIYDERNWFLTRADSDVSIFEEPNL